MNPLGPALDNPVWSCLSSWHAHFSHGGTLARRYHATISPIAGLAGDGPRHVAALEALAEIGEDIALLGSSVPALGANWETLHASQLTQMVRMDASPLPEPDADVATLDAADVPEMLALVELTKPGPFRQRTIELGTYIGIREDGRLIAMAGERMQIDNLREMSAVCTHPDAQGRGYARALIGRVVNRMLRAGETPFLHVESRNLRAIDVYRALGFVTRAEFPLLYAKRIG
jgi:ribosomal protein S18 acetylase RimI-like enzyme